MSNPSATSSGFAAIIVNYNSGPDLLACVDALAKASGISEIVVVDNCSTDDSVAQLRSAHPNVNIVMSAVNDGFGGGANRGVEAASSDFLFFLNPDVQIASDVPALLMRQLLAQPGVVGPVLHTEAMDGELEFGAIIDRLGMARGLTTAGEPLYVAGCALATQRHVFEKVGGFDARYFLFFEDAEYCWRVQAAGFAVSIALEAHADHRGGGSIEGGYPVLGWSTSVVRISLRERNALAAYVSCAPARWVPALLAAGVGKALVMSPLLAVSSKRPLALAMLSSIKWNAQQFPASLKRRKALNAVKDAAGARKAWSLVSAKPFIVDVVREVGLPKLAEAVPR